MQVKIVAFAARTSGQYLLSEKRFRRATLAPARSAPKVWPRAATARTKARIQASGVSGGKDRAKSSARGWEALAARSESAREAALFPMRRGATPRS